MNWQSKILVAGAILALALIISGLAFGKGSAHFYTSQNRGMMGNMMGGMMNGTKEPASSNQPDEQEWWQRMHQACLAGNWQAMGEIMSSEDWQAMHQACLAGDWEEMTKIMGSEEMQTMHAACQAQMGKTAQGMMGGMMGKGMMGGMMDMMGGMVGKSFKERR